MVGSCYMGAGNQSQVPWKHSLSSASMSFMGEMTISWDPLFQLTAKVRDSVSRIASFLPGWSKFKEVKGPKEVKLG